MRIEGKKQGLPDEQIRQIIAGAKARAGIKDMSICYDPQKWKTISLIGVTASLTVGLVLNQQNTSSSMANKLIE